MDEFTQQLMTLQGGESRSSLPSAIFGTVGRMARHLDTRPRVRIGLWPLVSQEAPETAMGVMTVLSYLLQRWQDIHIYHLFANLEGEASDYIWTVENSQFDVDDWQLASLDENVAIWGTLEQSEGQWQLTLEIENDLEERTEETLTYSAATLTDLINVLPQASEDIAKNVGSEDALLDAYEATHVDDVSLALLLDKLFKWQVRALLALWGQAWEEDEIKRSLDDLVQVATSAGDKFASWAVTSAVAYTMQPGFGIVAENIAFYVPDVITKFPDDSFLAINFSTALLRLRQTQQAYDLLEAEVTAHPHNTASWSALAELYRLGGKAQDSLDAFQRAIENNAADAGVYRRYATVLRSMDASGFESEEFMLIDPDEFESNFMRWEAAEAYHEALKLEPEHIDTLRQQLLLMSDLQDDSDRLWEAFEKLIQLDETGDAVREVADSLYNIENLDPGIRILKQQIEITPDRYDLYANLGVIYLNIEEEENARTVLERAMDLTDDDYALGDIERLLISVDDPEFEARLGEIAGLVNAGHEPTAEDAEYLEEALENAPMIAEAYVVLGKAYQLWDEQADALEILLDGHNHLPEDADIIENLARILWDSDEHELAFEYLNKGIEANVNHVPLLALAGQYLVEDDQEETAKAYLLRAETIAPRHPALEEARKHIARIMTERE